MTKKYTVQIRDTASKLGKLYCLAENIKLYIEHVLKEYPDTWTNYGG